MSSVTKKTWFWILQFLGWSIVSGLNIWGKLISRTELSKLYIYLEGFGFLLTGIIATLIVRLY